MRDPNRIYNFCNRLAAIWSQVPDWRFGQLMNNLVSEIDPTTFFYSEDEELFNEFEKIFSKWVPKE